MMAQRRRFVNAQNVEFHKRAAEAPARPGVAASRSAPQTGRRRPGRARGDAPTVGSRLRRPQARRRRIASPLTPVPRPPYSSTTSDSGSPSGLTNAIMYQGRYAMVAGSSRPSGSFTSTATFSRQNT